LYQLDIHGSRRICIDFCMFASTSGYLHLLLKVTAGGPGRQDMWRPVQCTKEPYRHVIWAKRERTCRQLGGWECRKHCTKECRRRVTVHAPAPCAAFAYALARRG